MKWTGRFCKLAESAVIPADMFLQVLETQNSLDREIERVKEHYGRRVAVLKQCNDQLHQYCEEGEGKKVWASQQLKPKDLTGLISRHREWEEEMKQYTTKGIVPPDGATATNVCFTKISGNL